LVHNEEILTVSPGRWVTSPFDASYGGAAGQSEHARVEETYRRHYPLVSRAHLIRCAAEQRALSFLPRGSNQATVFVTLDQITQRVSAGPGVRLRDGDAMVVCKATRGSARTLISQIFARTRV